MCGDRWGAALSVCALLWAATVVPLGAQAASAPAVSLTLGDAIRLAMSEGAAARAAQYLPVQAEARARQARSALLPDIGIQGTDGQRAFNSTSLGFEFPPLPGQPPLFRPTGEIIGPKRTVDYRGRVTVPLVDLGARERLRSARTLIGASTADAAVAADEAGATAALAYIQALRAMDQHRARNADSALAADLVRITQEQEQAGVGVALDVTRARAKLATTRAQVIAARSLRDRTRLDLLRLLDLPGATMLVLTDSLEALAPGDTAMDEATAVRQALAARPELLAADRRLAALRQSVAAVRAERLPSLRFMADYGVNGDDYGHLLRTYSYGIVLSVSLFDGAFRRGRLQEQAARLQEAKIQYRALRDRTEVEVRTAMLDLVAAQGQVGAAREAVALADQEVVQARDRYRGGATDNADVVAALLARTVARTVLIDALAEVQNARIALARAQGTIPTLR